MHADDHPTSTNASHLYDVLDRVLDKGVVIDAEISVRVVGLEIAGIEARIVVASIETYLEYADLIATHPFAWRSGLVRPRDEAEGGAPRSSTSVENRAKDYWNLE